MKWTTRERPKVDRPDRRGPTERDAGWIPPATVRALGDQPRVAPRLTNGLGAQRPNGLPPYTEATANVRFRDTTRRIQVMAETTAAVLEALALSGLLLKQDKHLPNVVTLLTGESLHSSWWSHPKGRLIFAVLSELSDHPDVLFTKLLLRKVTLVHRRLWPALLAVASASEPWQLQGLGQSAQHLLGTVNESKVPLRSSGHAVKELELRLLVRSEAVHTETGRHATALETWSAWARRASVTPLRSSLLGRQQLATAANALGAPPSALPWSAGRSATT